MSTHYIYRMDICKNDLYHGAYIGQHKIGSKDPSCDGYKGSGCRWKREILSNHIPVTKTILRLCDDVKEANFWEEFYIDQAKQSGEYLWNVAKGGGGHDQGRAYTDEEIRQHSKERFRKWYEANQEHVAEYRKQYFEKNREAIMDSHREYNDKNKESVVEYRKQYYRNNKDRIDAKNKKYYELHKEESKERMREYNKQYSKTHAKQLAEKAKLYNDEHKEDHKKYRSQLCCYNGETLTLTALSNRLRRKYHMSHPTQEAKKYLIKEM